MIDFSNCKNKGKHSTQMINKDFQKLLEIRKLLKEAYDHYFENDPDPCCKSAEGQMSVHFGNYWDNKDNLEIKAIEIYSYVFGMTRLHSFKSVDEALETVKEWHKTQLSIDYESEAIKEKDYWENYYKRYPEHRVELVNLDLDIRKLDKTIPKEWQKVVTELEHKNKG